MRKIWLGLLLALLINTAFAQKTELTGDKKNAMMAAIDKAHQQLTAFSAHFTQVKSSSMFTDKVTQKGKINYKSPKMLRWEYTSPKPLTIIFNNGKTLLKNSKGTTSNPNRMLSEMGNLIINTLNGQMLQNNPNFTAKYYKDNTTGAVTVQLKPLNKKISTYYKSISIILNSKTLLADKVILDETNGDSTTITFTDKQTNITLSDSLFK